MRDAMRLSERSQARRCPYCRDELDGSLAECPGCHTSLHAECWAHLDRCPTPGCRSEPAESVPPPEGARLGDHRLLPLTPADLAFLAPGFRPLIVIGAGILVIGSLTALGHRWPIGVLIWTLAFALLFTLSYAAVLSSTRRAFRRDLVPAIFARLEALRHDFEKGAITNLERACRETLRRQPLIPSPSRVIILELLFEYYRPSTANEAPTLKGLQALRRAYASDAVCDRDRWILALMDLVLGRYAEVARFLRSQPRPFDFQPQYRKLCENLERLARGRDSERPIGSLELDLWNFGFLAFGPWKSWPSLPGKRLRALGFKTFPLVKTDPSDLGG